MAFQLSNFTSAFKGGGARSSLFEVSFSGTEPVGSLSNLQYLCKATTIPPSNISSIDVPFLGRAIKVAGDRTFEPWTTTILNDEDFQIRNTLELWMDEIKSHKDIKQKESSISGYQRDMILTQYTKTGTASKKWTFVNAWPGSVSEITLACDTPAFEEFTCSWNYDYWKADTATTKVIAGGNVTTFNQIIPPAS